MIIDSIEKLEQVYSSPIPAAAKAVTTDHLIRPFISLVEASPFFTLATCGPEGLDCSARGDPHGFVQVQDPKTILFPDRPGNNKIESLRNIVRDPRVSLLFLIPGTGTILRINGKACISTDEDLRRSFALNKALPKSVIIVTTELVYMQCPRALLRSRLWDSAAHIDHKNIPSIGDILSFITDGRDGGKTFDKAASDRMARTLW